VGVFLCCDHGKDRPQTQLPCNVHLCFYGSLCSTYCQQTVIEGPTKFVPEDLVTTWFCQLYKSLTWFLKFSWPIIKLLWFQGSHIEGG
jgi:hypothetical protein